MVFTVKALQTLKKPGGTNVAILGGAGGGSVTMTDLAEKEGLTVLEISPGIDLERDVLAQADFPLKVSPDLRQMDKRLYRRAPLGLEL